jgi:hypothetical protein
MVELVSRSAWRGDMQHVETDQYPADVKKGELAANLVPIFLITLIVAA